MEKSGCVFEGKEYPDGYELCAGDQCIQCDDGKWEPGEFQIGYWY